MKLPECLALSFDLRGDEYYSPEEGFVIRLLLGVRTGGLK